ncbi:MAG: Hpt domain-containing protein [Oscillospiraceae bacterium]|nr:Hpt domain-containing protein [Oscillospiraceae bacterium]
MEINDDGKMYIDLDDALKRVGGNMALYKKLLGRFVDSNYIEAIENALQSGNNEESARHVHTLKGVSANLSLVKVRVTSIELEEKIHSGQDCSSCLADLRDAFDATLEKIAELLEQ